MTEVVVDHFELNRVPQTLPRARADAVYELVPQL